MSRTFSAAALAASILVSLAACDPGGGGRTSVSPCRNGIQDSTETGVDCGGTCGACSGATCAAPAECASQSCVAQVCAAPTCTDGIRNGTELQVDCGGTCGACRPATCSNARQDAGETGIDCGGPCAACEVTDTCNNDEQDGDETGVDCGGSCTPCGQAPSCTDTIENGDETDTDCGGPCPKCAVGDTCGGGTDCQTGVCDGGVCAAAAASCTNDTQDGDETGKDCGGPCPGCATGLLCVEHDDCLSSTCIFGVCRDPSCTDDIQNQGESDVDCGGTRCGDCEDGLRCGGVDDCVSGVCQNGRCVSCSDEAKNQDESDVDCGGVCADCADDKRCNDAEDCVSATCIGGFCKPEGTSAGVCDIEADCDDGFYCEYTWNDEVGAGAAWDHVCLAERAGGQPGAPCEVLEDCAGFGCFNGFCSAACAVDGDCTGGALCASEENYFDPDEDGQIDVLLGFEYCLDFQNPGGPCGGHADCGAGDRCSMYLEENFSSGTTLDPDGPYKAVGRCEDELAGAADGTQCESDRECDSGVCGRQGICTRWCEASSECPPVPVTNLGTLQRVCDNYARWGGGRVDDPTRYVYMSDCVALNGTHSLAPCGPTTATPFQCGAGEACVVFGIALGPDVKAKAEYLCLANDGTTATGAPCDGTGQCEGGYCVETADGTSSYCSRLCNPAADDCTGGLTCESEPLVARKGKYLNNGVNIGLCRQ